jgi:hypothetical protein
MSRQSNRPRGRGSRPFVMFYTEMLQHPNFRRLSRRAVKLLMNVSASYSGFNNGDLAVTLTVMKPFGGKVMTNLGRRCRSCCITGSLFKHVKVVEICVPSMLWVGTRSTIAKQSRCNGNPPPRFLEETD